MHTMKTNLANIKNVLAAWDRPLMERKPKPVDRDEFERAHKAIKSSRYAEIKEGGKVNLVTRILHWAKKCQLGKSDESTRSHHRDMLGSTYDSARIEPYANTHHHSIFTGLLDLRILFRYFFSHAEQLCSMCTPSHRVVVKRAAPLGAFFQLRMLKCNALVGTQTNA